MSNAAGTALIVAVPEVEPAVAAHRLRLDPSAASGVPAHVTVLFPFMPAPLVDDVVLARLGALFAGYSPFEARFTRTSWFGEEVLWLAPDDPDPFRRLTSAVTDAFPDYPPYGGAYDGTTPHLTVGDRRPVEELRAAERAVALALPVSARVESVTLIGEVEARRRWNRATTFPLQG